jgi:hypothetical protein
VLIAVKQPFSLETLITGERWSGPGAPDAQTVVNGFVALPERGLVYDPDQWPSSETWIHTDGLLLRAALRYEDHLAAVRK